MPKCGYDKVLSRSFRGPNSWFVAHVRVTEDTYVANCSEYSERQFTIIGFIVLRLAVPPAGGGGPVGVRERSGAVPMAGYARVHRAEGTEPTYLTFLGGWPSAK